MKIIRFDAFPDSNTHFVPNAFFTDNAILMADSCWRPHRRPLFLPTDGFMLCEIRAAVKVSRLGKAIERKFAGRYYDEICLVNFLVREPDSELFTTPEPMVDDSLVHGEWLPLPQDAPLHLRIDTGSTPLVKEFSLPRDYIDQALESLSHEATFKTGDILVLPTPLARFTPKRDMHVKASANDRIILDFKIK